MPWVHIQRRLYRDTQPSIRELAREAIEKNQHPDPEWGSFAYEQLSWILPAAGQFENAIRQLSSLIQTDPIGPFFRMERSILYSRTGQFEYAKRDIESLADGRYRYQAQAFYYYWRDQPERAIDITDAHLAIVSQKRPGDCSTNPTGPCCRARVLCVDDFLCLQCCHHFYIIVQTKN